MNTEPQSIIHQVMRLERKLAKAVTTISRRRQSAKRSRKDDDKCVFPSAVEKEVLSDEFTETTHQDSTIFSLQGSSDHSSNSLDIYRCRTMDQSQFLSEIMIDAASDEVNFVHFFIKGSKLSEAIDKQMERLEETHPLCRFTRIDASLAPYIAARLHATSDRPTVVALKNGKLVNRLSDFTTDDCSELQNWVYAIELLRMYQ